jgi:predicted metal-dependent peptidase
VESGWTYGSSRILTLNEDGSGNLTGKGKKRHVQTESEWQEDVGARITQYVRSEIYLDLRYMESSLTALIPAMNNQVSVYATDGMYIYFNADRLCGLLKSNVRFLERVYLHSVLHCIYAHLWLRGGRNTDLWNIACDISVEYIIDRIDKPCTKRIINWTRTKVYDTMKERGLVSAAQIYNWILELDDQTIAKWNLEFHTDDHMFWQGDENAPQPPREIPDDLEKPWEERARQDELKRHSQGGDGDNDEEILTNIRRRKNKYSYREFLKRFTQIREEMLINPEEFDLSYYSYGLRTFGNIPLIEPLETRESRKIYEFVIVLDTSYSTKGELIEKFLNETLSMLMSENSFFEKIKLHIVQCDDKVTRDYVVENADDIEKLFEKFSLKGGGNTDFRPAFNYITQMVESGKFDNLGGVIYFTDGRGIYPMKKPPYKIAFVYFKEIDLDNAPAWAVTYKLDEEIAN